MKLDRRLLARILRDYPFQPATAIWRAVEIGVLLEQGLPEGRGLDLGCGDGLLTQILLERSGRREIVGVEPDPAEADLAGRLGLYSAVHVTGGADIPEPDASFDWVLSNSVLEHVDDLGPVLVEVERVLRPGGSFLFTVPAEGFRRCLRGPILPGVSRGRYLDSLDGRLYHLRYWPNDRWPELPPAFHVALSRAYLSRSEVRRWESISRVTAGILFLLAGGRRRPIEIQRRLGLRSGARMPGLVARTLAPLLSVGLRDEAGDAGCQLIVLRRQ